MIQGGWVCRACWRPNGPKEERCYSCHTPRDQQVSVEAGSLKAQTEPGYKLRGRLDASFPIVALVAMWLLRVTGVLDIIVGVAIVLYGLLRGDQGLPVLWGMPANIWVSLYGMMFVLVGSLKVLLAASVLRYVRWAYIVTLVLTVPAFALQAVDPPLSPGALGGQSLLEIIASIVPIMKALADTWLTFGIIFCVTALLLASFMRRQAESE